MARFGYGSHEVDYARVQKALKKFSDCENAYFNFKELIAAFYVTSNQLNNWVDNQGLPYIKRDGGVFRYIKLKDFKAFINKKATQQQKRYDKENKLNLAS